MSKLILLAEDDEDNRDLVSFIVRRSGLAVDLLMAENGQEAVDMAVSRSPSLILMDMQMPVVDGWTAVSILKADTRTQHIPVIAFTAQAKSEDRQRSIEVGCVAHCAKPVDPAELVDLIRKHMS